jgi:hypothetical protein
MAEIELPAAFAMLAVDERYIAYEPALRVPRGETMPQIFHRLEYQAGSRIGLAIGCGA